MVPYSAVIRQTLQLFQSKNDFTDQTEIVVQFYETESNNHRLHQTLIFFKFNRPKREWLENSVLANI